MKWLDGWSTMGVVQEGLRRMAVGGLATALLLAGCSGFGVRIAENPWQQICRDTGVYLAAIGRGDRAAIEEGVRLLRRDVTLVSEISIRQWLRQVADRAAGGDPSLARQNYQANCAPLPSPSNPASSSP